MTVSIRPVRSRLERSHFVNLPWQLYHGDPLWVPPLKSSVRALLDQKRHPFYDGGAEAEIEAFVAWDGRKPVGRVAAILNQTHNRVHDEIVVFFGFFECIDRSDVAAQLLEEVVAWAAARGAGAVRGPMNPSTNYECGLLVEGFHKPPVLMMTYNPRYYARLLESAGFAKAKDLLAYISPVHDASLERLQRLAERSSSRVPGLTTRAADLANFPREVRQVQEIYNSAWEDNWGFVPMSDAEIKAMARELKPLVAPGLLRFALIDDEPVAFLLCLPDWNPVLRDFDGSPWKHPLRTLKHLLRTKPQDMEGLRLITLGVKREHRKRGLEAVLIAKGLEEAMNLGYSWCEYSWILEDNELTKRMVRLMGGELYKTYRVYEKDV